MVVCIIDTLYALALCLCSNVKGLILIICYKTRSCSNLTGNPVINCPVSCSFSTENVHIESREIPAQVSLFVLVAVPIFTTRCKNGTLSTQIVRHLERQSNQWNICLYLSNSNQYFNY